MPFNLLKKYPELLDFGYMNDVQRNLSLKKVFQRDIEDNPDFKFRDKRIWPIKGDDDAMQILFKHLTTSDQTPKNENGQPYSKRMFEIDRSRRLHWIKFHIDELESSGMFYFSIEESDKGRDVIRTYIYDSVEKYVIVLEPQRTKGNYYLLTAYYLNKPEGVKTIKKKIKRKLADVV